MSHLITLSVPLIPNLERNARILQISERVIYILGKFRKNHDSNRQYGGKCEYHIQGEYFKTRSKRMELQGKYVHIAYITDHVHVHYVSENEISY